MSLSSANGFGDFVVATSLIAALASSSLWESGSVAARAGTGRACRFRRTLVKSLHPTSKPLLGEPIRPFFWSSRAGMAAQIVQSLREAPRDAWWVDVAGLVRNLLRTLA